MLSSFQTIQKIIDIFTVYISTHSNHIQCHFHLSILDPKTLTELDQSCKEILLSIFPTIFLLFAVIIVSSIYKIDSPQIAPINLQPDTPIQQRISMDDSHIGDATQYHKTTLEQDQLIDMHIDSEILLSHISYQSQPDSPEFNINAAEAKIKELTKTADPHIIKKSKPYCGCGQYYSCTSSLYLHIRSKHGGNAPPGTIGGPKGIVKKPNPQNVQQVKVEQTDHTRYNMYQPSNPQPIQNTNQNNPFFQQKQLNNNQQIFHNTQSNSGFAPKNCKICGKSYSCNSSLNLHLKRKHQVRRLEDGRIEVQARPEDRQPKNFQCTICGLNYGSKSALGLHYNNKHNAKTGNDQLPYTDGRIQKCGCGLIYQSRSALNMHVKKKHGGQYPQGTSEKPNLRTKGRSSQNYVFHGSEEERHSIYDSQSEEGGQSHPKNESLGVVIPQRIFRCGCGRNYSCSSSLNLHIKKNHNWIVPKGTIGGPRGMRSEEQKRHFVQQQTKTAIFQSAQAKESKGVQIFRCGQCNKQIIKTSHFECRSCDEHHHMCSDCFWSKNNFNDEHQWNMSQIKTQK